MILEPGVTIFRSPFVGSTCMIVQKQESGTTMYAVWNDTLGLVSRWFSKLYNADIHAVNFAPCNKSLEQSSFPAILEYERLKEETTPGVQDAYPLALIEYQKQGTTPGVPGYDLALKEYMKTYGIEEPADSAVEDKRKNNSKLLMIVGIGVLALAAIYLSRGKS